jgi:HK97 family phage portal protein
MGWLSAPRVAKDAAVIDGAQQHMFLEPFGYNNRNNAGEIQAAPNFTNYAENGYGRNELVYSCIRYRAESLPQSVLRVYPQGRGEAMEDHPLRRVLANPNPLQSEFEMWELASTYKDLGGTAFIFIVRGRNQAAAQLWPLMPHLVGVLPGRTYPRDPTDYVWVYRPDPNRPDLQALIAREDMLRVRYPNPDPGDPGYRWFGMPPLRPGARATTLDNAATDFVDSLLRNHGQPSTVVTTQAAEMTEALHDRLTSLWRKAFGGPRKGSPAFLQRGMDVKPLGFNLRDLEFPDLRSVSETRICSVFAVEPILVGAKEGLEHNAYKDYREARLSFWEESMVTEQRRFGDPFRSQLLPDFNGVGRRPVRLEWDNSGVIALKESQQAQWDRATRALQAGGITVNDFRVQVGLPDLGPAGDIFLTPAGVTASPVGDNRPTPQQAVAASYGLLAAEFGIELTQHELEGLKARALEG